METVIPKQEVPEELPSGLFVRYANREFNTGEDTRIRDLSPEGLRDLVEKVRDGTYESLYLTPDEDGEIEPGFLQLESAGGSGLIFLQICGDEESKTAWACFDPAYLDSDEESPIEASDGQSVIGMKTTMRDRALAAKCVEWYLRTGRPYPGMDWLKLTW